MEHQYLNHMVRIFREGSLKTDRTGTGTRSLFGLQMRHDLKKGFPLLTTKRVHFKSVVAELLWILSGSTNVKDLQAMGCTIWDEWANEDGELGPIYGHQWRNWSGLVAGAGIDQISAVIEGLRKDPDGRRHIVSAWNVEDLRYMALSPCHAMFQFYVADNHLSCQLYQRSADWFLGVPFNIASYALLTQMVAQQVGLDLGELVWTGGDCHLYLNHEEQVIEQLMRTPRLLPQVQLNQKENIFQYTPEDIILQNYDPYPAISAPVAV